MIAHKLGDGGGFTWHYDVVYLGLPGKYFTLHVRFHMWGKTFFSYDS